MNLTLLKRIRFAGLACSLLLVAGSALANPYGFHFVPGQHTLVMNVNEYAQIHASLVNTGDNADTYHLSVTKDFPANWTLNTCYDGTCYEPEQFEFTVPETGTLAPGAEMLFDFDVTSLFDEGPGTFTLTFSSNGNPAVSETLTFSVATPVEDAGFVFSFGTNVVATDVNQYVQLHAQFYNAGTTADSYTVTATRDMPADWTASVCYDGICYPPETVVHSLPEVGTMAPGTGTQFDLDFTTLFNAGTGKLTLDIVSNTNASIAGTYSFICTTEGIVAVGDQLPGRVLGEVTAAPNPFNPRTEIRFEVGGEQVLPAAIDIYDLRGQKVRTLAIQRVAPGAQSVSWDGLDDAGRALGTGVYLAKVHVGEISRSVKMTLVK